MDNNELPKIHCTTHVVLKNKLTGKVYKDEVEEMQILMTLTPKPLQIIYNKILL